MRLAPCGLGDVCQLEELAPPVRPRRRRKDRACTSRRFVERIVAAIGVSLQDAGIDGEMDLRMLSAARE
jgi:hypothetical protein